MSRVALVDPVFYATNPASFARHRDYFLFEEDGETPATIYAGEEGTTEIPQPLRTDEGGVPLSAGGALCWVESGSYVREVDSERQPVELPKGSSVVDLSGYQATAEKDDPGGYAGLDGDGKIATSAIPPLAAADISGLPFVSARSYGAVGNGTIDDTAALKAAIAAAIAAKVPLYLPPGTYKTTEALKAEAANFCIFGAGQEWSILKPNSAAFDALTIGTGSPGIMPSGYARDFQIAGGGSTAEIAKTGVASTTGKAALKLNGVCLFEVTNVGVTGSFDIGFDLVNNCYGSTFKNARTNLNSCRVGLNLREGLQSGNDLTFFNCWLSGEVAAAHVSPNAGGIHFVGGQLNSNRQATVAEDLKGSLIIGKDYTTGTATGETANVSLAGIDFEGSPYTWFIRGFNQQVISIFDCSFLGTATTTIGVYKNAAFGNSHVSMLNARLRGTFSANASALATVSGGFGAQTWFETGTGGGGITTGSGEVDVNENTLAYLASIEGAFAPGPAGRSLGASYEQEVASATEIKPRAGATALNVIGTTTIKKIAATRPGHILVLRFAGACTVQNGENLKLHGNFVGAAETTLCLECNGTNWYELARSIANNRIESHTFSIAAPTAAKLGGFFIQLASGEAANLKGVRYKTDSGTCKLKVKRTTAAGATSEVFKEKEAKTEAQEQAPGTELASNDYLSLEVESVSSPTFLVATFLVERTR